MTTRRLRNLATAVGPWLATASLLAAPVGHPTPPPCSADGVCVPARPIWGYTKTDWRRWPGTAIGERPEDRDVVGGEELGPTEAPDPTTEDRMAPPKVEAIEPTTEGPGTAEDEFELPDMDDFENGMEENGAPDAADPQMQPEADPLEPPRPGFLDREPTDVPFGEQPQREEPDLPDVDLPETPLPFGQPPEGPGDATEPPDDLFPSLPQQRDQQTVRVIDDAPPPLPFGSGREINSKPRNTSNRYQVTPASANVASGSAAARAERIPTAVPAGKRSAGSRTHTADSPPAMPAVLRR